MRARTCVLSPVGFFVTSWTPAHQAPLSVEFSIVPPAPAALPYPATGTPALEN